METVLSDIDARQQLIILDMECAQGDEVSRKGGRDIKEREREGFVD